jgi:hypothetical protein
MASYLYKWSFLLILLAAIPTQRAGSAFHPVYISVTEINHNAAEKTLEISCKIFTNDFEQTLTKAFNAKVDLFNPRDKAVLDKQITDYMRKHLILKTDGKPVTLELVGYEREDDALWSYFQVNNITTAPKKLDVSNSLLYDMFNQQINLMHVTVGGQRKSTKLNYPDMVTSFQF